MTAVHTVTLVCDGKGQVGCPGMSRLILETDSHLAAREEARLDHGWSVRWSYTTSIRSSTKKKLDICPACDPQRRSTR